MCSIIASFNVDTIRELSKLNAYRGQHSHSVYVFARYTNALVYTHRALGPLDIDKHDLPDGYIICHQQAPTTDNKDESSIHPAELGQQLLWHNGIIKANEVKRLQKELESTISWDTKLMLLSLLINDADGVKNIDGSFSCVWFDGSNIFFFRNEISPLFYRVGGDISSTKFDGSQSLEPNKVWMWDDPYIEQSFYVCGEFDTVNNPYFGL